MRKSWGRGTGGAAYRSRTIPSCAPIGRRYFKVSRPDWEILGFKAAERIARAQRLMKLRSGAPSSDATIWPPNGLPVVEWWAVANATAACTSRTGTVRSTNARLWASGPPARGTYTSVAPHTMASTGLPPRRNETASDVSTWVPGNQYQHRSAPGWEWTRPTASGGHAARATTRVAVAALSSVANTDVTRTVAPSTEPSRQPRRSVGLAANAARSARAAGASSRRGNTTSGGPNIRPTRTAVMVNDIAPPFSVTYRGLRWWCAHLTRPKLGRRGQ